MGVLGRSPQSESPPVTLTFLEITGESDVPCQINYDFQRLQGSHQPTISLKDETKRNGIEKPNLQTRRRPHYFLRSFQLRVSFLYLSGSVFALRCYIPTSEWFNKRHASTATTGEPTHLNQETVMECVIPFLNGFLLFSQIALGLLYQSERTGESTLVRLSKDSAHGGLHLV